MRDTLVYGTEIAVGLACGIASVILLRQRAWLFGVVLAAMSLSALGHAVWAWFLR